MTEREYGKRVKELCPGSPTGKDTLHAFWVGGLICTAGQLAAEGFCRAGMEKPDALAAASLVLVVVSALLTGLSVYDDIAKFAGAGTLVPITGFANAIAAPAIEYKTEGFIAGVGAKMFTIAGPVLVYGSAAGAIYGVIYWLLTLK